MERRHIEIQLCELHIIRRCDNAPNGSFALQIGVFFVGVLTGVYKRRVFGKRIADTQLVPVKQLLQARLRRFDRFPEYPCAIRAKLCFIGINGSFCFMVDRAHRVNAALDAAFRYCGNRHIVLVAELFDILL